MRNRIILILAVCLLCTGCKSSSDFSHSKTDNSNTAINYSIISVDNELVSEPSKITYPQIICDYADFAETNKLIQQEVDSQLKVLIGDDISNVQTQIEYTTSFSNSQLICFLFEGNIYRAQSAHAINLGFSICVSLEETKIIDPTTLFKLDNNFVDSLRLQLNTQPTNSRFTEAQWIEVVAFIDDYSNKEILTILQSDQCAFSLAKDELIVLFPVPHPIGDYLKIAVPYLWSDVPKTG